MNNSTPMMRQYQEIKRRHPNMLLFFRLGDFYEMFYEDAVAASRELEITLTSRNKDQDGTPIPMCGVPHHAVDSYLAKLIRKGFKVAICEQTEEAGAARKLVHREVTRVVTPGTVIQEGVLDSDENNFMASLSECDGKLGAAFLDVSTGEFLLTESSEESAWVRMQGELEHFQPREVILAEGGQDTAARLPHLAKSWVVRTPQPDWTFGVDYSTRMLLEHFKVSTLEGFGINGHRAAIAAAGALLHYVKETQKTAPSHVTRLRFLEPTGFLKLDESTIANLELVKGADGNRKWTLLGTINRTRTPMGARLLRSWMLRPGLDLKEIEDRLDAVEELHESVISASQAGKVLSTIQDLERLMGRVTLQTANARDLLALKESLRHLPELAQQLASYRSVLLQADFDLLTEEVNLLEKAIALEPPVALNEGGLIRDGYHPALDELREISRSGKKFIAGLEAEERENTGISSLKVKYNRVFGYFIEVTRTHLGSVPSRYQRKQTLVGSERFITPELKEYEEKVLTAQDQIVELERKLFVEIRSRIGLQAERIQKTARAVARIDTLLSLAEVARSNHYTRPSLNKDQEIEIRGGRHPVVELLGNEPFVPNDLTCGTREESLLILTGPNMGGKSTYLRQNALIVVLAQMGSFVPADTARIGLVDRIFTRVGASDNLARGQSTFMVEMVETATILNSATSRSLILLDEVGRGTATFDGLSIAWAVAESLLVEGSCRARTLFATHYQELTQLEELYPGVRNYSVRVQESQEDIIFFHRVVPGAASKSYGIEVARLAGLPPAVIQRAREILARLERKELNLLGRSRSTAEDLAVPQKTLF